jgi:hypothetical protein
VEPPILEATRHVNLERQIAAGMPSDFLTIHEEHGAMHRCGHLESAAFSRLRILPLHGAPIDAFAKPVLTAIRGGEKATVRQVDAGRRRRITGADKLPRQIEINRTQTHGLKRR